MGLFFLSIATTVLAILFSLEPNTGVRTLIPRLLFAFCGNGYCTAFWIEWYVARSLMSFGSGFTRLINGT